jgi:hypothetical protein
MDIKNQLNVCNWEEIVVETSYVCSEAGFHSSVTCVERERERERERDLLRSDGIEKAAAASLQLELSLWW